MKIGPFDPKVVAPTAPTERKAAAPTGAAANSPGPTAEPSAQVDLSAAAALLSQRQADPAFDTAKVERIAQAIRDGKFEVNPETIADKLIANAQELLGRKPN